MHPLPTPGPAGPPGESGPFLFLAYPHFCGADPSLARNVTGLSCDPEKHTLFLDVEPVTGVCWRWRWWWEMLCGVWGIAATTTTLTATTSSTTMTMPRTQYMVTHHHTIHGYPPPQHHYNITTKHTQGSLCVQPSVSCW